MNRTDRANSLKPNPAVRYSQRAHRARPCAKLANSSFHKFYFIKPVPGNDAGSLANMLLLLKGVEEVHITDGEYGLIVKARVHQPQSCADSIGSYIAETLNEEFNAAVSYYRYRK